MSIDTTSPLLSALGCGASVFVTIVSLQAALLLFRRLFYRRHAP